MKQRKVAEKSALETFVASATMQDPKVEGITLEGLNLEGVLIDELQKIRKKAAALDAERKSDIAPMSKEVYESLLQELRETEKKLLAPFPGFDPVAALYPELDPAILKRFRPDGLPALIPYGLSENKTSISLEEDYDSGYVEFDLEIDKRFRWKKLWSEESLYRLLFFFRTIELEEMKLNNEWEIRLGRRTVTFELPGVMPREVRDTIALARYDFDEITIYSEPAQAPDVNFVFPPADPDPVAVGIRDDRYYLIAAYDMTPTEEFFATTPPGMAQLLS